MASNPALVKQAKNISFNAADLGSVVQMDPQGRVLFSPELRRALGIENASVRISFNNGRFDVLSEAVYAERRGRAEEKPEEDLEDLERAGLL